jgi:hypothetical protein
MPDKAKKKLRGEGTRIRRRNLNIDQVKLDRAVEVLGANSETEAVDEALDMFAFREALLASVQKVAGKGGIENFFEGGYADELKSD